MNAETERNTVLLEACRRHGPAGRERRYGLEPKVPGTRALTVVWRPVPGGPSAVVPFAVLSPFFPDLELKR